MTASRLTGLPKGKGDVHFDAFERGESIPDVVGIVKLRAHGVHKEKINNGIAKTIIWEILRLEPAREDEATRLGFLIEDLYVQRTSRGAQTLPMGWNDQPDEVRRMELVNLIRAWAQTEGLTHRQLEGLWNAHFAVGEGSDVGPFGPNSGILHVTEFAYLKGIIQDEVQGDDKGEKPADEPDEDAGPTEADVAAGYEPTGDGSDEPAEASGDTEPAWSEGYPEGSPEPAPVDA